MFPILRATKLLFRKRLLPFLAVFAATVIYDGAQAYLVIKPTLTTTNSYGDNPRLRGEELANALVFTKNDVIFDSTYVRPTYELGLRPRFRLSRYTEETELNSEEYFVSSFANKLFERHQLGVAFDYRREATFFTELEDSGILDINLFRTSLDGQVNWSYLLSDKVTLSFNSYVSDVAFEEDPRSSFVDYFLYGTGASVNYKVSESTSFWAIFNRSSFKTPQISSETESYSLQLGFDHELTETTYVSFRIGKNISHLESKRSQFVLLSQNPLVIGNVIVDEEDNASGDIAQLTVEKKFSRAELKMQWDRRFSPSSQGARQELEEVQGDLRYRLTQFIDITGGVRYRTRIQEGALSTLRLGDLEIFTYNASLIYRLSPTLRTEIGYKYREQTRLGQGTSTEGHRAFVQLRYSPSAMRFW